MWLDRSFARAALTLGLALVASRPSSDSPRSAAPSAGGDEEIPLRLAIPEIVGDYDPASVRRVVASPLERRPAAGEHTRA